MAPAAPRFPIGQFVFFQHLEQGEASCPLSSPPSNAQTLPLLPPDRANPHREEEGASRTSSPKKFLLYSATGVEQPKHLATMDLLPVLDTVWSEQELSELEALTRDGVDFGDDSGQLHWEPEIQPVENAKEPAPSSSTPAAPVAPEQKKKRRAERNREHARRSRARKKVMVENVERSIQVLQEENSKLRTVIEMELGVKGRQELRRIDVLTNKSAADSEYTTDETASEGEGSGREQKGLDSSDNLVLGPQTKATQLLTEQDYSLLIALKRGKQNFLITDPRLPDNPIVFASAGFMTLTGYSHEEVLGRNCRFLQGPDTDPVDVERIRNAVSKGEELSVCLLNYKKDGSTFWNQFFITPLRDPTGRVVNFVGVQQIVTLKVARLLREQARGNLTAFEEERELISKGDRLKTEAIVAEQLAPEALRAVM